MTNATTRRRWTAEDDALIRELYPTHPAYEVAARLGRSTDAVWKRVPVLGLEKRHVPDPWTEDELADLRRSYATQSAPVIAARLGRTASAVRQQAAVLGLNGWKVRIGLAVAHHYFDVIDSAEKAYILGLLAADGNVSDVDRIQLGLQAKDEHLVRTVRGVLSPRSKLAVSANGFVAFNFTSHPMAAALARWSIVPRKSRIIAWPARLGGLQRPFLLGYFDGDGSSFTTRNGRGSEYPGWTVCSGSQQFLVDMKAYIHQATGIVLEKIHHRPRSNMYQVATTGRGAYVVDVWLHQYGFGLERKRPPARVIARYL